MKESAGASGMVCGVYHKTPTLPLSKRELCTAGPISEAIMIVSMTQQAPAYTPKNFTMTMMVMIMMIGFRSFFYFQRLINLH